MHAKRYFLLIAGIAATMVVLLITTAAPIRGAKDTVPSGAGRTHGCSAFSLDNGGYAVFSYNKDHDYVKGFVVVNKRFVAKSGLEPSTNGEYAAWVSKYGSVTFNHSGYQLPSAGMNEAGLVISTHALDETENPAADGRPPIVSALWAQYVLDNFSTVEEVLASDADVRISDTVDHYLICDRTGECAAVEFLGGQMVVHTGATLPVKALTNNTYEDSVEAWQEGSAGADGDVNSLARFLIAADRVAGFQPTGAEAAVAYAFETLALASQEATGGSVPTAWTIVFDAENMRVFFRTLENQDVRTIDFSELDFACDSPVQMLDIHAQLAGDISDKIPAYSHKVNLDHMFESLEVFDIDIPSPLVRALVWGVERAPCVEDASAPPYPGGARSLLPPVFVWLGFYVLKRWELIWVPLVVVSLVVFVWGLASGAQLSKGRRLAWALVIVLFGPIALLIYWLVRRWHHRAQTAAATGG